MTVFVYEDKDYEATLRLCDETSPYPLTGAVFARDRYALEMASQTLRWVSPRTIKETFLPATDYRCPFMDAK